MPKPLIFAPGFPGSELIDKHQSRKLFINLGALVGRDRAHTLARLAGPADPNEQDGVVAGGPIRKILRLGWLDLGRQAETLYDVLADIGYDILDEEHVRPIGWDWRLPIHHDIVQDELEDAIRALHRRQGERVVILCHSTGGLIARWCLERLAMHDHATLDMVDQVIAIGVPWAGTLKPVRYVGLGESVGGGLLGKRDVRRIMGSSHAAYDLMPIGPQPDGTVVPPLFRDDDGQVASPLVANRWLPAEFHQRALWAHEAWGERSNRMEMDGREVRVTNLVGYGMRTDTSARLQPRGASPAIKLSTTKDGDGTVPRASAAWLDGPEVHTFHVPYGAYPGGAVSGQHGQLWDAPPARSLIEQILSDAPRTPYTWAALDPDDVYRRHQKVRIHVVGLDPDGQPLSDARAYTVAVGRRRKGRDQALDASGRAVVVFDRTRERPSMNRYYVPVELAWNRDGEGYRVRFDVSFLA